jgi:hypothetical protein
MGENQVIGDIQHKLGNSIQDCVTIGGSVLAGVSMECGSCNRSCIVQLKKAQFTSYTDLLGVTFFCPYCGTEGKPQISGRIIDIRSNSPD